MTNLSKHLDQQRYCLINLEIFIRPIALIFHKTETTQAKEYYLYYLSIIGKKEEEEEEERFVDDQSAIGSMMNDRN